MIKPDVTSWRSIQVANIVEVGRKMTSSDVNILIISPLMGQEHLQRELFMASMICPVALTNM